MIFLKTELNEEEIDIRQNFEFKLRYEKTKKQYWKMEILDRDTFSFYLPEDIFNAWKKHNLRKSK